MIRLQGVEKTYRTRRGDLVLAVADITLDIAENEFVTLVGPSGCGKSTLLKLVAGLTPASGGTIRVRDTVVRDPFPDVGIVFQHPVLLPFAPCSTTCCFPLTCSVWIPKPIGIVRWNCSR